MNGKRLIWQSSRLCGVLAGAGACAIAFGEIRGTVTDPCGFYIVGACFYPNPYLGTGYGRKVEPTTPGTTHGRANIGRQLHLLSNPRDSRRP